MLPLEYNYFIVVSGTVYPANKRAIEKLLPDENKKDFSRFIKEHKIRWKQPESLFSLLKFFKQK